MFDVITIGGSTKDVVFVTDAGRIFKTPEDLTRQAYLGFEYGAKIAAKETYFGIGGGAANAAVSLSRLGFKAGCYTAVGDDEAGKKVIEDLEKEKVAVDFVKQEKGEKTSLSFVIVDTHTTDHIVFLDKGVKDKLKIYDQDLGKLGQTKWIYLTSLSGAWEEQHLKLEKVLSAGEVKLAWNPGFSQISAGQPKIQSLLSKTEIFNLNKDEAIEIISASKKEGAREEDLNDINFLLETLHSWGPKVVLITQGKKGAFAYDGAKKYFIPCISAEEVDTIGAGDSFGSAFLAGYICSNSDIVTAGKYAAINGDSAVRIVGAQTGLLTKEEMEKKISQAKFEVSEKSPEEMKKLSAGLSAGREI